MSKKEETPGGSGNPTKQQEQHGSTQDLPPISHKSTAEEKEFCCCYTINTCKTHQALKTPKTTNTSKTWQKDARNVL